MGPDGSHSYSTIDQSHDEALEALRSKFPQYDICDLLGALYAVPRGTVVLASLTISGLDQKLAEHEATRERS